ncbi:formate dehydrogenase accessory sulfurtransferase FdhD [Geobacter pelophilus]|uniref:Multifunctional fusion protein n=1 Tax=Geoanaerobacter pelophilus TaxID=60036 RepID=A0AAW4L2K6_9BACT|nr:formate dehydrogenase accessory sulfurtransferase FdhD [Geoanaerobacter pelophilus]MBT0665113.1 formate dehydrogenase accessory sulfurtransferase FdhD [Geoanaerobacter pelophilus]
MKTVYTYSKGRLTSTEEGVVNEFPLALTVNGRELATLIASPHDLRFLVAGFLRLQGFVSSVADFEMLSVCNDYGIANVRIKGELPERLKPVLTSGCGTGITFSLPERLAAVSGGSFTPAALFDLMDRLAREADRYRTHGGIHSAAIGDGKELILYAEDIGRHNTLDRIAGEALLKGIDLAGRMLVTSGRVSTELAAKAALLGIPLIASRTSPTDKAVQLCDDAGITLIGYVRGGKFTVYSHPERLHLTQELSEQVTATGRIPGITGVILAGGESRRMGSNKALLPYKGGQFIEAIYRQHAELFDEVIVVTNNPELYAFLPCRKVTDLHVGKGALAGIHAGLHHSSNPHIFVTACDMPYLNSGLIRGLAAVRGNYAALVPESDSGTEPLHAFYGKTALPAMDEALAAGVRRIVRLFDRFPVRIVPAAEVGCLDPEFGSFRNINTPDDYYRLRDGERAEPGVSADCSKDQPAEMMAR